MSEKKFLDLEGLAYFKEKLEENLKINQTFLDYTSLNLGTTTFRTLMDKIKLDLKLSQDEDLLKRPIFVAFDKNLSQISEEDNKYGILLFGSIPTSSENGYISFINLYNLETYNTYFISNNSVSILFSSTSKNLTQLPIYGTLFETITLNTSISKLSSLFPSYGQPAIIAVQISSNPKQYSYYLTDIKENSNDYNVFIMELRKGIMYQANSISGLTQIHHILIEKNMINNNLEFGIRTYDYGYDIYEDNAEFGFYLNDSEPGTHNVEITTIITNDYVGSFSNFVINFYYYDTYDTELHLLYTSTLNLLSAGHGLKDKITIKVDNYETSSLITIQCKNSYGVELDYDFQYEYPQVNYIEIIVEHGDNPLTFLEWPLLIKKQKVEVM